MTRDIAIECTQECSVLGGHVYPCVLSDGFRDELRERIRALWTRVAHEKAQPGWGRGHADNAFDILDFYRELSVDLELVFDVVIWAHGPGDYSFVANPVDGFRIFDTVGLPDPSGMAYDDFVSAVFEAFEGLSWNK